MCWKPRFSWTNLPERDARTDLMHLRILDFDTLKRVESTLFDSPPLNYIRKIAKLVRTDLVGVGRTFPSTKSRRSLKESLEIPMRSLSSASLRVF